MSRLRDHDTNQPEETSVSAETLGARDLRPRLRASVRALLDRDRKPRRGLVLALGGLVAVMVLVVAPGYVASRATFLERYPNLEQAYSTWSTSTHAAVGCPSCHVPPNALARSAHTLRMTGEFYASILAPKRRPDLFGRPENDACERCHRDVRQTSPSGDLKIPHRAHVEVLGLDCVHCHAFAVHGPNPEGTHSPRMATCLECHDGRQAKSECSACHTSKAEPASHSSAGWLIEHPLRRSGDDCESCHGWTPEWCRDCHAKRPASHAGRWRSNHKHAVEKHRNCEACHRSDFCVRCHGELPARNLDPSVEYVE